MQLTLTVTQLAGWNIQWAKTNVEPAQKLRYLGVITDTVRMVYEAPEDKVEAVLQQIAEVIVKVEQGNAVPARQLAVVLGKLAAFKKSHGTILHVSSRKLQHELGRHTLFSGWDTNLF